MRNQIKFKGTKRELTKFHKKLTFLNVVIQVLVHIEISLAKFLFLIREEMVTIDREEVRCGQAHHLNGDEVELFRNTLDEIQREVNEVTNQDRAREFVPPKGEAENDLGLNALTHDIQQGDELAATFVEEALSNVLLQEEEHGQGGEVNNSKSRHEI